MAYLHKLHFGGARIFSINIRLLIGHPSLDVYPSLNVLPILKGFTHTRLLKMFYPYLGVFMAQAKAYPGPAQAEHGLKS